MAAIDVLQFAINTSNVEPQTQFVIDAPGGFVLGSNAASNLANKVLRQTTGITSALAQFVSNANNVPILDNVTPITTASFLALLNTTFPTLSGPNVWTNFELPITIGGIAGSAANYAIKFNPAINKWQAGAFGDMALQNSGAVAITGGSIQGLSPPLPVASGGTGAATLTGALVGNGTNAVTAVAPGANGNLLTSNGTTWVSTAAPPVGLGGTWQDVTGQRATSTTYTNTTGQTIVAMVIVGNQSNGAYANVNGVLVWREWYDVNPGAGQVGYGTALLILQQNDTYSVYNGPLRSWWELRP